MPGYNPSQIEKKWQRFWADQKSFATDAADTWGGGARPKYYVLDMFPYPSGQGLHVGHPEGYTATDIIARYKRAKGFNVMHPMGWDAFGLPAEQYAIKNNVHPRETTANNVNRFRTQLQSLGFSYDWDREVDTTDPHYYKWTQWIFLKLYRTWFDEKLQKGRPIHELIEEFKSGKRAAPGGREWDSLIATERRKVLAEYRLAYEAEVPVNWCPGLGTVLANEEVIDGKSEVGGFPVERRPMRQWMLRITAYAKRLLDGLGQLDWSDSLKEMQRNWIGESEGAEVEFEVSSFPPPEFQVSRNPELETRNLTVFTTRPDTLFGATYMVVAPEHPLMHSGLPEAWEAGIMEKWKYGKASPREAVAAYRQWAASRSDRQRQEDTQKTGVFSGIYAINPVNQKRIPIFVSDYVLMGYGTGAIMAVPGHDERDHEFATKFKLPIVQVVGEKLGEKPEARSQKPVDVRQAAFVEDGVAVNSAWIEGLPTAEAKKKITGMLEERGIGKRMVNYKIRDWLFSRQRYWGEPFPLVHLADGTTVSLVDSELPLKLPELEDFKPTGTIEPPLSKAKDWVNVHVLLERVVENGEEMARVVPAGTSGAVPARRELNTMPQWAGSCWYYIRYLDSKNDKAFVDPAIEKYWLGAPHGNAGPGGGGGVDLYIGGVEHAVLHLLYSRFWHKVLFDRELATSNEPFKRLVNQGLILGEAEFTLFKTREHKPISYEMVDPNVTVDGSLIMSKHKETGEDLIGERVDPADAEKKGDSFVLKSNPSIRVDARSFKMSKSRGNVVNPDDVIKEYGADSLRMFEMFMGPLEQVKPWSTAGVEGVYRFLQRVWRNIFDENDNAKVGGGGQDEATTRALHRLIKKIGDDIERLSFNTAIAAMMEFNNLLAKAPSISVETAMTFARILEPFAPHFAEEVHAKLGGSGSISKQSWPTFDPAMLIDATIEVPVQVNGKLRSRITLPSNADEQAAIAAALADPEVQKYLAGKELKKKIYVRGRMVNLVI